MFSLEITGAARLRSFAHVLACAARSCEVLFFEPSLTELRLRAIAASRTAHSLFVLPAAGFDRYSYTAPPALGVARPAAAPPNVFAVSARGLAVSVLRALLAPTAGRFTLESEVEQRARGAATSALVAAVESAGRHGVTKRFRLHLDERPPERSVVPDDAFGFTCAVDARTLLGWIGALPPAASAPRVSLVPGPHRFGFRAADTPDAATSSGATSQVSVDPRGFHRYHLTRVLTAETPAPCGKTVDVKALRLIAAFADAMQLMVQCRFGAAGVPLEISGVPHQVDPLLVRCTGPSGVGVPSGPLLDRVTVLLAAFDVDTGVAPTAWPRAMVAPPQRTAGERHSRDDTTDLSDTSAVAIAPSAVVTSGFSEPSFEAPAAARPPVQAAAEPAAMLPTLKAGAHFLDRATALGMPLRLGYVAEEQGGRVAPLDAASSASMVSTAFDVPGAVPAADYGEVGVVLARASAANQDGAVRARPLAIPSDAATSDFATAVMASFFERDGAAPAPYGMEVDAFFIGGDDMDDTAL